MPSAVTAPLPIATELMPAALARLPSAEALASQQPFCVDSLAFEEWLQWIFLPRLKSMLEANAPLPTASGIAAMAEQVFVGRALEVKGLIAALEEFDRLIGLGS